MTLIDDTKKLAELEKQADPVPWGSWWIGTEANTKLIPAIRNASPKMLKVLGAFQKGDRQKLVDLLDIISVEALKEDSESDMMHQMEEMLRRLAEAAKLMEADNDA